MRARRKVYPPCALDAIYMAPILSNVRGRVVLHLEPLEDAKPLTLAQVAQRRQARGMQSGEKVGNGRGFRR